MFLTQKEDSTDDEDDDDKEQVGDDDEEDEEEGDMSDENDQPAESGESLGAASTVPETEKDKKRGQWQIIYHQRKAVVATNVITTANMVALRHIICCVSSFSKIT